MPHYVSREEVYRILQRELPEGVYPDGPASAFYSTADNDAIAATLGTSSNNLERIYENFFPQTADEKQADWEDKVLGYQLDATTPLQDRRDKVIARIRSRRRTTPEDIIAIVKSILGPSVEVEVAEWGCGCAGWVLDVSQLDISTILNGWNQVQITGPNLCTLDADDYGMTEEEFLLMKEEAYTYEVRLIDYTPTALELEALDKALTAGEPARSGHIIVENFPAEDTCEGTE